MAEGTQVPAVDPLEEFEKALEGQYAELWRQSKPEFLAHFKAISRCAGMDVPESHSVAVAETSSANTWREAYIVMTRRFFTLAMVQMLALGFGFWQNVPLNRLALVPVAITLVYLVIVRFMEHVITAGCEEMWQKRSFAMKAYLSEVVDNLGKKQAQDERRDLR